MHNNSPRIVCSVISLLIIVTTQSCNFPLCPCKAKLQHDLKIEIYKKVLFFYIQYTHSHVLSVVSFTFTSSILSGRAAVPKHCSGHIPSPAECVYVCFVWVLWKLSLWTSWQSRDSHRLKVKVSCPSTSSWLCVLQRFELLNRKIIERSPGQKGQKDRTRN